MQCVMQRETTAWLVSPERRGEGLSVSAMTGNQTVSPPASRYNRTPGRSKKHTFTGQNKRKADRRQQKLEMPPALCVPPRGNRPSCMSA
jgi:hypothetical protein